MSEKEKNILTVNYNSFPSTRYQGSKRKLLEWLKGNFEELEFNSAVDLFGGTGSVSFLLKSMGKKVLYNDFLKFNSIIGKALIENAGVRLSQDEVEAILNYQPDNAKKCLIAETFQDIYYTHEENLWIDKTIEAISNLDKLIDNDEGIEFKRAIAYFSLFQGCLSKRPFNLFHRANLYLRLNETVERNFGNKTTWEKSFEYFFQKFVEEANKAVYEGGAECAVTNFDALDVDVSTYDLVYIDPPYYNKSGSNETANYPKVYHFLEGIARYNEWKDLINYDSKNLRFHDDYLPKFGNEDIYKEYDKLLTKLKDKIIVISYKKGSLPSINFFTEKLRKLGKKVRTRTMHYKYALNKQNGNAKMNREVLIIAE